MGLTKIIASILLLMAFVVAAQAQVTVTLVDGEGKPVAEATVEANKKVIGKTDADGTATLDASFLHQQLCFTHVSFQLFCEKVTNNVNKFTLKSNDNFLDAAVVTSYENTTRRNTVGNVASIDMSRVPVLNTSNALSALQGLAPGLDIQMSGGGLGQASKVRVQGDQSLLFASSPIYVVDGVVISEYQTNAVAKTSMGGNFVLPTIDNQNARGNFIDFLDFNNIESITILKDADAVAIYGSRGANGAIVIKTKKAISDNIQIISSFNLSKQPRRISLMNTDEYLQMRNTAIKNSGITNITGDAYYDLTLFDSTENNDWQNIVMGHSVFNYSLMATISSIGNNSSNRLSFGFRPNKHFFDKNSSHFNQFSLSNVFDKQFFNKRLRLVNSTSIGITSSMQQSLDFTLFAIQTPPNFPREIWNSKEVLWEYKDKVLYGTYSQHPLYRTDNILKYKDFNIINSFNLNFLVAKNISYDFIYGTSTTISEDIYIENINKRGKELYTNVLGSYRIKNSNSWRHNFESFFTLKDINILKKINLVNILGINYNTSNSEGFIYTYFGNPISQYIANINHYNDGQNKNWDEVFYKYFALYNRINAKYNNIIFSANFRYDGSSRFSPENRWASFYSFGIGWNLSDESWFKNKNLYIKPRLTYGRLGNDNIPDYGYLQRFNYLSSQNYPNNSIVREINLYSKNYKWEDLRKINMGLDFKYRDLSVLFDYSITTSKDQLIDYRLPDYLGQASVFRNFPGIFQIKSLELNIAYTFKLSNSSKLSLNLLLTKPKDKLIDFPDIENSSYANTLEIGKSKFLTRYFRYGGVDNETGLYYYLDSEGKPIARGISEQTLIETPIKYYGSILIGLNLKKINLSANIFFRNQDNINRKNLDYSINSQFPGSANNNYRYLIYENFDAKSNSEYQKFLIQSGALPQDYLGNFNNYFIRLNNLSLSYRLSNFINKKDSYMSFYVGNILLKTNSKEINYESNSNMILPSLTNMGFDFKINF